MFGESVGSNIEVALYKKEVIDTIIANRTAHIDEYKAALNGYYLEVAEQAQDGINTLNKVIDKAKKNKDAKVEAQVIRISARKPVSHEADYDRVLKMLDMAQGDTITLSEISFSQYILDEWEWKNEFVATNSFYSGKFGALTSR